LRHQNRAIAKKLDELEQRYDAQFKVVFEAIREMMEFPTKKVRKIGFTKYANQKIGSAKAHFRP